MIYLLGGKKNKKIRNPLCHPKMLQQFNFVTKGVSYLMKSYKIETENVHTLTIKQNTDGSLLLYTAADMT